MTMRAPCRPCLPPSAARCTCLLRLPSGKAWRKWTIPSRLPGKPFGKRWRRSFTPSHRRPCCAGSTDTAVACKTTKTKAAGPGTCTNTITANSDPVVSRVSSASSRRCSTRLTTSICANYRGRMFDEVLQMELAGGCYVDGGVQHPVQRGDQDRQGAVGSRHSRGLSGRPAQPRGPDHAGGTECKPERIPGAHAHRVPDHRVAGQLAADGR